MRLFIEQRRVKRIATSTIILVQFWMLAPVCCCWLKEALAAQNESCCCAVPADAGSDSESAPAEKDSNCRCSENKIELPSRTAAIRESTAVRVALDPLLLVPAPLALFTSDVRDASKHFWECPPPLTVARRLSTLHRFNL